MAAHVYLEILQAAERLLTIARLARVGLLARVDAHMYEQFVPGIEFLIVSFTIGPKTEVAILFARLLIDMAHLQVANKLIHVQESVSTIVPFAHFELVHWLVLLAATSTNQIAAPARRLIVAPTLIVKLIFIDLVVQLTVLMLARFKPRIAYGPRGR